MLAKLDLEAGQLEQADGHLRHVIENSKDAVMQHIARLRRVALALDRGDVVLAEQLLNIQQTGGFESRYDELRGDIFSARKGLAGAIDAYRRALTNSEVGSVAAQILERKLNSVSRVDSQ